MSTMERVPWMNREEWECCRDNLFGENHSKKKAALQHLYIWKVRCTNLPIAVECTLILMDVHLKGKENENDEMFTNTMNYESWYSVAIMRFLNLITDSNVGNKSALSMNQLAKQYGIPEWIVDIRNTVAHGPLLSNVCLLQKAVEECLSWLYKSYWSVTIYEDPVSNRNETTPSSTFLCFEACFFLKKYISFGFEDISDVPAADREKIDRVLPKNTERPFKGSTRECSLIEIHKGLLKKLGRHLKKDTNYRKNFISSILETDQYFLSRDAVHNNELSKSVFSFWSDIVFVICESSLCHHFLLELINVVKSPLESSWRQRCAAFYVNEILVNIATCQKINLEAENAENNSVKKRKKIRKILTIANDPSQSALNGVGLTKEEIRELIRVASEDPNENVEIFLRTLLSLSPEYLSRYEELRSLIDTYTGSRSCASSCVVGEDQFFSVPELCKDRPNESESLLNLDQRLIVVADQAKFKNDWENTALGLLPDQINFQPWRNIYDLV